MSYLLDTNIISDLIKDPQGVVMQRIEQLGEDEVATSIIVAAELRFGAEKKGSAPLIERVNAILSRMNVLPLVQDVDQTYGNIRTLLEAKGTPIGANDLFIAAHARSLDMVLVTANVKEFERVVGLKVENWLK